MGNISLCSKDTSLAVIKLGSSVLTHPENAPMILQEIYNAWYHWPRLVVFVSALGNTTDQLNNKARTIQNLLPSNEIDPITEAELLSMGEYTSVKYLQLILKQAGLPVTVLDNRCLLTEGSTLNATPKAVDENAFEVAFKKAPIIVIPGFLGFDANRKHLTLLGRGGSDLSAIFCAWALKATGCMLLKDVNGIFSTDPNLPTGEDCNPHYQQISFDDICRIHGSVVQAKALQFAHAQQYPFTVKSLEVSDFKNQQYTAGTKVGGFNSILSSAPPKTILTIKIILSGNLPVINEVKQWLSAFPQYITDIEIVNSENDITQNADKNPSTVFLFINLWSDYKKIYAYSKQALNAKYHVLVRNLHTLSFTDQYKLKSSAHNTGCKLVSSSFHSNPTKDTLSPQLFSLSLMNDILLFKNKQLYEKAVTAKPVKKTKMVKKESLL